MIEVISNQLARKIKDGYPEANTEVISYEIGRILNHYGIIFFTCLISWLTGEFYNSLIALIGFATIRKFSGGLHLKLSACTVVSVTLFCTAPFIRLEDEVSCLLTTFSVFLFLFFSPKYKITSMIIVSSNFFINSPILTLMFITQGLLILPLKGGESR